MIVTDGLSFVYNCIYNAVSWLRTWQIFGTNMLYVLVGFAVVCLIVDYIF